MSIYLGLFAVTLSMLALEVSLVRLLSVTTWYHLSFFAISTAMLGMTAGATSVYLRPNAFDRDKLMQSISASCIFLALSVPVTLTLLCLVPLMLFRSVMCILALLITTMACALPYYFAGIVVSAILTKTELPIGRLYASDLLGASLGCLFVLFGLERLDAPSLILLCGATSAAGGLCFSWQTSPARYRRMCLGLIVAFLIAGTANSFNIRGIRPVVVKGAYIEPATRYLIERWNSFSRVAVYRKSISRPQYWGPSLLAPTDPIEQYKMNIDGDASTTMCRFESIEDIEHLRYDVTNIGYHLGRKGPACVIGVGGGRDIQSAILFGHSHVTGIDINPIFIDLLQDEFRKFAGIAERPDVTLVKAEARSYLAHSSEQYAVLQMSLIDTWAATGAGAFSLAENCLYTIEAWTVFLNRLAANGIFTVSRWHSQKHIGETGRVVALAVGTLLRAGEGNPAKHVALITTQYLSTLLVSRCPFSEEDINRLMEVSNKYRFNVVAAPGHPPTDPLLRDILSADSYSRLLSVTSRGEFNYAPPTDESPYFFNMLRLRSIAHAFAFPKGVIRGNLIATGTLGGLLLSLSILCIATIIVPLMLRSPGGSPGAVASSRTLWHGAVYFSLIGAAFMLTEIALIQRLTILLSHPIYALGIILFTIILSAGVGSLLSDRLPLARPPWLYVYPVVMALAILSVRMLLSVVLRKFVTEALFLKIACTVVIVLPMGCLMGMFFPTGMRLAKLSHQPYTPWYWALNGIFGVLSSALAVFFSIYVGISTNFYIASLFYGLTLIPLELLRRQARSR